MPAAAFRIEGGRELERALIKLADKVQRKIIKKAIRKPARSIVKMAKTLVPRESGLLAASLGTKIKQFKRSGTIVGIMGPRTKFKAPKKVVARLGGSFEKRKPANYAHLIELGTKPHIQPTFMGGGMHPGSPAKPFLGPAMDAHKSKAFKMMGDELRKGIEAEARKAAK